MNVCKCVAGVSLSVQQCFVVATVAGFLLWISNPPSAASPAATVSLFRTQRAQCPVFIQPLPPPYPRPPADAARLSNTAGPVSISRFPSLPCPVLSPQSGAYAYLPELRLSGPFCGGLRLPAVLNGPLSLADMSVMACPWRLPPAGC